MHQDVMLSRALPQTTGRKDFKSTSGVGPLQDFPDRGPTISDARLCTVFPPTTTRALLMGYEHW